MEKENYRAREVSALLNVGLSTVWLYVKQRKLNPIKLSERVTIFKKEDLDRFIKNATSLNECGEEGDKSNSIVDNRKKDDPSPCVNSHSVDFDKQTGDTHEC